MEVVVAERQGVSLGIANSLTLMRIAIGPLFLLVYLHPAWFGLASFVQPFALLLLLAIVELSDLLDGYFARKYDQVTNLGKILDPMADSITRLSVFFSFTQGVVGVPLLLVFAFFYRDAIISTLRTVCALRGVALAARKSGKLKAVLQGVVAFFVVVLMIPLSMGMISTETFQRMSFYAIAFAAAYTVLSLLDYFWVNRDHIKEVMRPTDD